MSDRPENENKTENKTANWPWSRLGLDKKTADQKAIKRPYAKQLKVTRPNTDPAGFRDLRKAFEAAKNQAYWLDFDDRDDADDEPLKKAQDEPADEPEDEKPGAVKPGPKPDPDPNPDPDPDSVSGPVPDNGWQAVWRTTEKTAKLLCIEQDEYDDDGEILPKKPGARGDSQPDYDTLTWRTLIENPALERLDLWEQFSNTLRWQIAQHAGWDHENPDSVGLPKRLPKAFAEMLVSRFDWFYETHPHNPHIEKQSAFLRRTIRASGIDMPGKPVAFEPERHVELTPKKLPFFLRWQFFLLTGGIFLLLRFLMRG